MQIVSVQKGTEWKRITTAVMGVIKTIFSIKTYEEGEREYIMIASEREEIQSDLLELAEMFKNDLQVGLTDIEGKIVFTIVNTTPNGQDIIVRKLGNMMISM
jgi:KaiC/GvpD/RAD55 family RecA-like ATPase